MSYAAVGCVLVFLNNMPCMGVCRTQVDNDLIVHVGTTKVVAAVERQLYGRARTACNAIYGREVLTTAFCSSPLSPAQLSLYKPCCKVLLKDACFKI